MERGEGLLQAVVRSEHWPRLRNPWHYSVDLWKYWDAIDVPILVIRGQQSDLLPEAVLKDMMRRNRNVDVHTIPDCGHAPPLIADDQIEVVAKFLDGND